MRPIRMLLVAGLAFVPRAASPQGGAPVGPEFRVNTYTTSSQYFPSVAADVAGNFVVAWSSLGQDAPGTNGVFAQRYDASGAPVGGELRVNSYSSGDQLLADVASDGGGNFVVTWTSESQDGALQGIFAQRFASTGPPLGQEFRVNTFTTGYQVDAAVAARPAGDFVVVWVSQGQDGSGAGIFGQRYTATGAPLGLEFRVNTYSTAAQAYPAVAVDPSGNFIVAWTSFFQDGSSTGVFGQRYAASGAPLGPEFRVNTVTTSTQSLPSVAVNGSGNFVVVWMSDGQDGSSLGVFGQRYAATGAPLGPEFRVNSFTLDYQAFPAVASDISANFVVTWTSFGQDGSGWGVFGQRYVSAGAPLGPEFQVNTATAAYQQRPSVAAAPTGPFIVAWDSDGQDGSGEGVFGQRYGAIVPVELMHFRIE